jgi:hypothetical protein
MEEQSVVLCFQISRSFVFEVEIVCAVISCQVLASHLGQVPCRLVSTMNLKAEGDSQVIFMSWQKTEKFDAGTTLRYINSRLLVVLTNAILLIPDTTSDESVYRD